MKDVLDSRCALRLCHSKLLFDVTLRNPRPLSNCARSTRLTTTSTTSAYSIAGYIPAHSPFLFDHLSFLLPSFTPSLSVSSPCFRFFVYVVLEPSFLFETIVHQWLTHVLFFRILKQFHEGLHYKPKNVKSRGLNWLRTFSLLSAEWNIRKLQSSGK